MSVGHAERTHGLYSPSQAERLFLCAGSARLCARVPDSIRARTNEASDGDKAHDLAAYCMSEQVTPEKAWITMFPNDPIDVDMCVSVTDFLDYIDELCGDYEALTGLRAEVHSERKIRVPCHAAPGEADGHGDAWVYLPAWRILYIIDLKYGQGVMVGPVRNKQLSQYGAGVVFGGEVDAAAVDEVVLVIVQPRSLRADQPVMEWTTNTAYLLDYLFELEAAIELAQRDDAPLNPGPKQCQFCDAAYDCPALEAKSLSVMGISAPQLKDFNEQTLPSPDGLPVDKLAYVKLCAPIVRKWLKECEETALRIARHGVNVPGFKLVEGDAQRAWNGEPEELAQQLMRLGGFGLDDVMPRKLIALTQAETMLKNSFKSRVTGKKAKSEAARKAVTTMAFLTLKQPRGASTLAPLDDARPNVVIGSEFSNVKIV